jgi:hypothetical protein
MVMIVCLIIRKEYIAAINDISAIGLVVGKQLKKHNQN